MKKILAGILIASFIVAGCSINKKDENSTTTTTAKKQMQGKVEFEKCGQLQCATISVPMNYKKPKGRKIKIALAKLSAADPAKRIGVLLVNPGGPGASGIDLVRSSANFIFTQEMRDQFDIIGWDPRGVGASTKVACARDLDFLFDGVDYSPDTDAELAKLKEVNESFGKKCEKADKELLPFLSTENSVKDMDSIRKELGEKQINYLGFSYGTVLGQIYATNYPKNFRTMVIDGVVDLEADPVDISKEQTIGFEDALNNFFDYCRMRVCTYTKGQNPRDAFLAIMKRIDATPIQSPTDPSLILGPAQFDIGSSYFLYSGTYGWQSLDSALASIVNSNDPTGMLSGFTGYVGREGANKYDGSYSSFLTIGCSDGNIGDVDEMVSFAKSLDSVAPVFGESGVLLGLPCATWYKTQEAKPFDVDASGSAPIVVIGTTGDPATPVQWARNAAEQLKTGVYVERRGEGHTAYGQGNDCIDELVNTYFLTAKEPSSKVCQ